MFARLIRDLWLWDRRRTYRVGAQITRFVARDIRRDIKILDASKVDDGFITVASRTWNVLYDRDGTVPKPEFGKPKRAAIKDLWKYNGPLWGGPFPDDEGEGKP